MNDNYLSINEINELAEALRLQPEVSYVNIGINMGDEKVEIFTPDNFTNLYNRFFNSVELNSSDIKVSQMKEKFLVAFKNLEKDGVTREMKIGKLCSAFVFVKRSNWAPNWYFYHVPNQYLSSLILNYLLRPQSASPLSFTSKSPAILFEQNVMSQNSTMERSGSDRKSLSQQRTGSQTRIDYDSAPSSTPQKSNYDDYRRNKGDNGGRGRGGGRGNNGGRGSNDQEERQMSNQRERTPYNDKKKQVDLSVPSFAQPAKLFGGPVSTINTHESKIQSTIPAPTQKQSSLELIKAEKSKLVSLIKSTIKAIPHTKILCNKETGYCEFVEIEPSEKFESSIYQCCPYHTGKSFETFGQISASLRAKISGPYGYFTSSGDCYDFCYLGVSSNVNSDETIEIETQRKSINKILAKIETEINDFNNLVESHDGLVRQELQAKQNETITNAEVINSLGENSEKNIQAIQAIATDPLFKRERKESREGRARSIEFFYPTLPIMHYKAFSTIFGNMDNLINSIDVVNIKASIVTDIEDKNGDITEQKIPITVPTVAKSLILKQLPDVRNKVVEIPIEISSNGERLQIKFINHSITFQFSESSQVCSRIRGNTNVAQFGKLVAKLVIYPVYEADSYRGSIFNIGSRLSYLMGLTEHLDNKYDIISMIGACFISKFSDLVDFISDEESGIEAPLIENSPCNKFTFSIDNIQSTIDSINEQSETDEQMTTFTLNDTYPLTVSQSVAESIVDQLLMIPQIKGDDMIFQSDITTYTIPIDNVTEFFKLLNQKVSSLSIRAKKEDREEENRVKKAVEESEVEDDGWTTFESYKSEIETNSDLKSLFSGFGTLKSSKNSQRSAKKVRKFTSDDDDDDSKSIADTATVVSGITMMSGMSTPTKKSEYNSRYFEEVTDIMGYNIDGFEAQDLLLAYSNIRSIDIENRVLKVSISSIPVIDDNLIYIVSTLFEDDSETIEKIYVDGELVNRALALSYILFGSSAKYFRFKNEVIKLKSELFLLNPFKVRRAFDFGIPYSEAKKSKLINKYMGYSEEIDKTAILARKTLIEKFGDEIFRLIFTGYQTVEGNNRTDVTYANKKDVIPVAGQILQEREKLKEMYSSNFLTYLNRIAHQDNIENRMSSFYGCVNDYIVFMDSDSYFSDVGTLIQSNPYYATHLSSIVEDITPEDFIIFVDDSKKLQPMETRLPSQDLLDLIEVLYSGASSLSLHSINLKTFDAIENIKFTDVIFELGLIIKFFDITSILKFPHDLLERLSELQAVAERYCDGIVDGKISANKAKDDLPSINDLPQAMNDLKNNIRSLFVSPYTYKGKKYNLSKLFDTQITFVPNLSSIFLDRRFRLRDYVKELISKIYDVTYVRGDIKEELKFQYFSTIEDVSNNGNNYRMNPDSIDVIAEAINKVYIMIDNLDTQQIETHVKVGKGVPTMSIITRQKIFLKFSALLLNASGEREYDSIKTAVYYYLIGIFDKSIYDIYFKDNYNTIMNEIGHDCSLARFQTTQDNFATQINEMSLLRDNKIKASNSLTNIKTKISSASETIEKLKSNLTDTFIEYVATIDIIMKSYESRKKSYGSDDSQFNEIIDDMKLRMETIVNSYSKVMNIDIKITLSIFDDNFKFYQIRKDMFRDFGYNVSNLSGFDGVVNEAVKFVKIYAKLPYVEQVNSLNSKLSEYGLTVTSTMSEIENITRDLPKKKNIEISEIFFKCKYAYEVFTKMRTIMSNIRSKMCNNSVAKLNVPIREDQPKPKNYGDVINRGISDLKVDEFTNLDLQTLSKTCYQLLENMNQGLRVIDCGPGMHLLSDCIENVIKIISCHISGTSTTEALNDFKSSFTKFNVIIGKSVNDIIQASEFRVFVDVISGKMELFNSLKSSIPYYMTSRDPYPVYDSVTTNFVSGILLTMAELSTFENIQGDYLLERITLNTNTKYGFSNIQGLVESLNDFNNAIIPFIDEYLDDNNKVLSDQDVLRYRTTYYLKTSGTFMNRVFEKLNYCIRKFIESRNSDFEPRVIERFSIYIELLTSKMKSLTKLETHMIKR